MASPGYTSVTASNLRDASGVVITNATAVFTPNQSFRTGDPHGQTVLKPISVPVTNGALSTVLADTSISNPANVSYRLVITDNSSGDVLLAKGYTQLQPSGASWSLDDYVTPLSGPLALVVTGLTGAQGPPGLDGVASLPQLANMVNRIGQTGNYFSDDLAEPGYLIGSDGNVYTSQYWRTVKIQANSGGKMVANFTIGDNGSGARWLDINDQKIGMVLTSVAAGTVLDVPATASTLQLSYSVTPTNYMIAFGSTLGAYRGHRPISAAEVPALLPANISSAASISDIQNALGVSPNLFRPDRITNGTLIGTDGNIYADTIWSTSDFTPVNTSGPMVASFPIFSMRFYDANKVKLPDSTLITNRTANNPFTPPAGSMWCKWSWSRGDAVGAAYAKFVLVFGSVLPAQAKTAEVATMADIAMASASSSSLYGKRYGIFGDSITQSYGTTWLPTLESRTGMTQAFLDARNGRRWSDIFEYYGGSGMTNNYAGNVQQNNGRNTGVAGNTLAQDLANVDMLLIALGTNPMDIIGTPQTYGYNPSLASDTTSLNGVLYNSLQTLQRARPSMQIILVSPYLTSLGYFQYWPGTYIYESAKAAKYNAALFGYPTCNLAESMGVSSLTEGNMISSNANHTSSPLYLVEDGIHPSALGGARMGNILASFLLSCS